MSDLIEKKKMTEEDIKFRYITPAIVDKWDKDKITMENSDNGRQNQSQREFCFKRTS